MSIILPTEIQQSNKTPRVAVAFDRNTGVQTTPDTTREVMLIGQQLATGDTAASIPTPLLRDTDGADRFGAGSMLDIACRAAFKANPAVILHACGVADAGTKATATLTFATNATGNTLHRCRIANKEVVTEIAVGDTPTVIGAAFVAALAAASALDPIPVTAVNAAGVVTLTAVNGGVIGNSIELRSSFDAPTSQIGTTAALSASKMGTPVAGVGSAVTTAALAACIGKRYHLIADLIGDTTSGAALKTHTDTEGQAEQGHGEIYVEGLVGTQSAATTLALAQNAQRGVLAAINGSETWGPEIAAAMAAVMSSEELATRPYNTLVLNGVKPPPIEKRWSRTELRILLNNGVTPLVVNSGEQVCILRAVSMAVKNTGGSFDYSLLDITKIQAFDFLRDMVTLMFQTNYPRALWSDDDPDGELPAEVATPSKVRKDLIDVAYEAQALGIVSNVAALESMFSVEKVGTQCRFAVPAAIVDGMHEILGKIVYFNRPLAA